jgi:hypothetical protein
MGASFIDIADTPELEDTTIQSITCFRNGHDNQSMDSPNVATNNEFQHQANEHVLSYEGNYIRLGVTDKRDDRESWAIRYLMEKSGNTVSKHLLEIVEALDDDTIQEYMDTQGYDDVMMVSREIKKFNDDDSDRRDRWFHVLQHGIYINSVLFVFMDSLMHTIDESWYTHVPDKCWKPVCRKKPNLLPKLRIDKMHDIFAFMSVESMIDVAFSIIKDGRTVDAWILVSSLPDRTRKRILDIHADGHDIVAVLSGLYIYENLDIHDSNIHSRIMQREQELISMRLDCYESSGYDVHQYIRNIYSLGKNISRSIHDMAFDCQMMLQGEEMCQSYIDGTMTDALIHFDNITPTDLNGMRILHDYILSNDYDTRSSPLVKNIMNCIINPRGKQELFMELFLKSVIICDDRGITISRMLLVLDEIMKDIKNDDCHEECYITHNERLRLGIGLLSSWVDSDDTDFPYEFYKESTLIRGQE